MSKILVITCPSGKQCSHLISKLYKKDSTAEPYFSLRLAAHSEKSATRLAETYPKAEIRRTDLSSLADCVDLVKGATAIYHVGPSFHSREKEMGFNMIDAAVAESRQAHSKFEHFVYSSVLGSQHRGLMQHDLKSYVEERLMLSPLQWTILQPTNFMNAYPVAFLAKQDKPVMERLWHPDTPNSMIELGDLAEAAEKVLKEGQQHYFAQYPLCSTTPTSDRQVAEVISKKIAKTVEVKTPTFETAVTHTLAYLFGDGSVSASGELFGQGGNEEATGGSAHTGELRYDITRDEAERLCLFYNHRGLVGSPNVLRWLLGKEPTGVEAYVEAELRQAGIA